MHLLPREDTQEGVQPVIIEEDRVGTVFFDESGTLTGGQMGRGN